MRQFSKVMTDKVGVSTHIAIKLDIFPWGFMEIQPWGKTARSQETVAAWNLLCGCHRQDIQGGGPETSKLAQQLQLVPFKRAQAPAEHLFLLFGSLQVEFLIKDQWNIHRSPEIFWFRELENEVIMETHHTAVLFSHLNWHCLHTTLSTTCLSTMHCSMMRWDVKALRDGCCISSIVVMLNSLQHRDPTNLENYHCIYWISELNDNHRMLHFWLWHSMFWQHFVILILLYVISHSR